MRRLQRTLFVFLALALSTPWASAQAKQVLLHKVKVGDVFRYQTDGKMVMEAAGMKMNIEIRQVEKSTVTEVAANGNITMESVTESVEVTMNGQKGPPPDDLDKKSITVIAPDGSLVSYKSGSSDTDSAKLEGRMFYANNPIFAAMAVGVGDKWTKEFAGNSDIGIEPSKAEYELVAFEKVKDIDAAKIKMSFKENGGTPPITTTTTVWVDKASGDSVQADFEFEGVPFGGKGAPPVSGKMHMERLAAGAKAEPKKDKNIDETVKDYEKLPGFVTLYKKKESGRETVYMEIPEALLGKHLMLEATAGTGTASQIVAGEPISDTLFKFVQVQDDKIQIVVPNYSFRADPKLPISKAVKRSFPEGILEQFKIEAKQADRKSVLINVSNLFVGDIAQVSAALSGGGGGGLAALLGGGGGGYGLDREKTYVEKYRVFPENLVVETQYHFTGGRRGGLAGLLGSSTLADPRSLPLKVVYTLFPIKEDSYKPRIADPRVGYFLTEYQDFSRDDRDDQNTRFIYRWNLQKSDPKAKLSPPVKPITFWLDNAIPTEYRDSVKKGLMFWNKAFERIGIKDAIVVNQMPDNADWDTADMRYNVIRWVASPDDAYAVAQFRTNPMTGEILNASITVDAGITKFTKMEHNRMVTPSAYFEDAPVNMNAYKPFDPRRCSYAREGLQSAWFGLNAINMLAPIGAKIDTDSYVKGFISDVVSHEMGHIMGLRHNFIASTQHSLTELANGDTVKKTGVAASVMDYTPFNVSALKSKGVPFWAETVGSYDLWAIEYGYCPIDSKTPEGELSKLKAIASKCNEEGHLYQSDEVADSFDPAVTRFDLGHDPLDYHAKMLGLSRYMLLKLGDRVPKKGESYWEFTRNFNQLMNVYARAASTASRYLGALHVNRNHKGDPGEKPTLVPASIADQRRALKLLNDYIFSESALTFPKTYYTHFTENPNEGMMASILGGGSQDFPVKDTLAGLQASALRRTFSAGVLRRMSNNEFKMGSDKSITMPQLFSSVSSNIWSEAEGGRNVNVLRRQLQRVYVDTMTNMTLTGSGAPEDARMMAWDQLRKLKSRLTTAKGRGSLDTYTKVHYDECLARVSRVLDAKQVLGMSGGGGGGLSLLDLLGGEDVKQLKDALANKQQ
jgi:hypothetical protein